MDIAVTQHGDTLLVDFFIKKKYSATKKTPSATLFVPKLIRPN